jgi:hypothetical protein
MGKADGTFADLRLSSAERLIKYYGLDAVLTVQSCRKKGIQKMLLAEELKVCACEDSPEKFRDRLIDEMTSSYPGKSIDDLVCNPLSSLGYCDRIRQGIGSECLYDVFILKSLLNIRKRKDCPTGLKRHRTRRVLSRELLNAGCRLLAGRFRELVNDCLADMYKSQTVDGLLCHPREAAALCNYVRNRSACNALSDELILSTLMNNRKSPH